MARSPAELVPCRRGLVGDVLGEDGARVLAFAAWSARDDRTGKCAKGTMRHAFWKQKARILRALDYEFRTQGASRIWNVAATSAEALSAALTLVRWPSEARLSRL